MADDYRETVRDLVLDESTFVDLTMKGPVRGGAVPWRRVHVRPVLIKNERSLQFTRFDARQDITKNYHGAEAAEQLSEILAIPFSSIRVRSTTGDLQIQVTKKGKAILHRSIPTREAREPALAHDRSKAVPMPPDRSSRFLQTTGILNSQGEIRSEMRGKYSQINEFLRLLEHSGELDRLTTSPIRIVDCGCGSAYLTFAAYGYLNEIRGLPATITGIEVNGDLVRKCAEWSDQLGYTRLHFESSSILGYEPDAAPDIVLALHACDTATDEALAQSILWNAHLVLAAPCCHHDLNRRIRSEVFAPVLRHGILKQRLADILTDTFRALALRIMGYRTDVIEFVSAEHTSKNLMIRAVRATDPGDAGFAREYNALKEFWGVTPCIERLLGEKLTRFLG